MTYDDGPHEHEWGDVEYGVFTGNPYRNCTVYGCRHITLDIDDPDEEEENEDGQTTVQ